MSVLNSRAERSAWLGPAPPPKSSTCVSRVGFRRARPAAPPAAGPPSRPAAVDATDLKQQVDIERLINCVQELQDKVEKLEGELSQGERRDRDRMVALRTIIKQSLAAGVAAAAGADGGDAIMAQLVRPSFLYSISFAFPTIKNLLS